MDPGAQVRALRASFRFRRLPLKEARILSEEHKAVLLVVIGYRQRRGLKDQGGGDPRVGSLFLLGRSFEPGLDLLRPVQGVEFLAADAIGFACSGLAPTPTSRRSKSSRSGSTRRKKFGESRNWIFSLREPASWLPGGSNAN